MILQTDWGLKPEIRKYGCYLLCLIKVAVDRMLIDDPTAQRINNYYETFLKANFINQNCMIKSPERILAFLGLQTTQAFHEKTGIKMPVSYIPFPGEIEILCYSMPAYDHFVLPAYDPYGGSPAVKFGKLTSKRIFRPHKQPSRRPENAIL